MLLYRDNMQGPQPCEVVITRLEVEVKVTSTTFERLADLVILIKNGAMDHILGINGEDK